jgi:hypothetical protein
MKTPPMSLEKELTKKKMGKRINKKKGKNYAIFFF